MLSFSGGLKVFLAVEPCDMRKSFKGLSALVSEHLQEDPRQGALFVFTNRRHTRLKILYWEGTGLWVVIKRLEKGTFSCPKPSDSRPVKCAQLRSLSRCWPTAWTCAARGCARSRSAMIRD